MSFLFPLGLLWAVSIPVLVWLWRLSANRRRVRVPSLAPFESLLKRAPKRKAHLAVNLLFWLQLAALIGAVLAVVQPAWPHARTRVLLAILDTSASMQARSGRSETFARAKQALLTHLNRMSSGTQIFVMTSAPVTALTPQPTNDRAAVTRLVQGASASDLGGNLSTTLRIGLALLGTQPQQILVVTDEPQPAERSDAKMRLTWIRIGEPLPNVAIVGVDAHGSFCAPAQAHLVVTVQNVAHQPQAVTVTARQQARTLASAKTEVSARSRASVSLALPANPQGWVEVFLASAQDALAVDNRSWVHLGSEQIVPVVVQSQRAALTETIATWLHACPALTWTADPPSGGEAYLLVTDQPDAILAAARGVLRFTPPAVAAAPALSHWVVSRHHPISAYFTGIERVMASLNFEAAPEAFGTPVVSALLNGRSIPVVVAEEREGRRLVRLLFDPVGSAPSTPLLIAFFNSLRWLMGHVDAITTGQSLTVGLLSDGVVRVRRPDGVEDRVQTIGTKLRYDATTKAGLYRVRYGQTEFISAANFFDPIESDTVERISTWHELPRTSHAAASSVRTLHSFSPWLVFLVLLLVIVEWWRYSASSRPILQPPMARAAKTSP